MLEVLDSEEDDERLDVVDLPLGRNSGNPVAEPRDCRDASKIPETPSSKRTTARMDEILSSQPSPFTPMIQQTISPSLYRSPLQEKSTNIGVEMPTEEEISRKSPLSPRRGSRRSQRTRNSVTTQEARLTADTKFTDTKPVTACRTASVEHRARYWRDP